MHKVSSPGPARPPFLASDPGSMDALAKVFGQIALRAGALVMDIYRSGPAVRTKADLSPVCDADEKAEALIHLELARFVPGIPILAEEAASRGDVPDLDGRFILVDPVDGTKEFLNRNGEFTVNIALVDDGVPCAGAVYAPALGRLWLGGEVACACAIEPGAELQDADLRAIHTRLAPDEGLVVMASRSHADSRTEDFLADLAVAQRRNAGSSLKFCALAEGEADLYPRFGPTMEWDTGAGDAVLRAAGGIVLGEDGSPFRYGKTAAGVRNRPFVAWGDPKRASRHGLGPARPTAA